MEPDAVALKIYTMREILAWADPPDPGVVEELLYPGQLSLLVGAPKAGKTTLARTLALAVARGEEWMGRSCTAGAVLIIEVEGSPPHERDAFRRLGAMPSDRIHMAVGPTDHDRETFLEELAAAIRKVKPALVIVDTLFRALHIEDGNDYAKALSAMDAIAVVIAETSAHALLIHHARKGAARTDNDLSLGSQALTGTADTNLFLRGKAGKAWLSSEQRYGRSMEKVKVLMDADTGWCHADTADNRPSRVLDAVDRAGGRWLTIRHIADETGMSVDAVEVVVRSLVKHNRLKQTGTGKPGSPRKVKLP